MVTVVALLPNALTAAARLLAADTPTNNFGDTSEPAVAGPLGLVVIVLMGVVTWLLYRSMNKRIKRLPGSFGAPSAGGPAAGVTVPDATAPAHDASGERSDDQ
jgi:hypothetical protein